MIFRTKLLTQKIRCIDCGSPPRRADGVLQAYVHPTLPTNFGKATSNRGV